MDIEGFAGLVFVNNGTAARDILLEAMFGFGYWRGCGL